MPDPAKPQYLNRYSYALNNPIRHNDPSGHCPLCLVGAAGGALGGAVYGYGNQVVTNLNQGMGWNALTANIDPGQIVFDTAAGTVIGGTLGVGLSVANVAITSAAATKAAATAATLTAAASADGDPTNELATAGKAVQSVWQSPPLVRGVEIENLLGRSPELTQNFPVIDRFEKGIATSIKSIDLNAARDQNVNNLITKVEGYVSTLAKWQGDEWGGVAIRASDIKARQVQLVVPPGSTVEQIQMLEYLQQWATTLGVDLSVVGMQ